LVAVATLGLIALGGLVTSKGVGMAVPDWPTTYGYNMFFFPIGKWEGGVFHEHVHRLAASTVGALTVFLAVFAQVCERRTSVRGWAWGALVLVIVQGLLGGFRVRLDGLSVGGIPGSLFFGVLHAVTAQIFLAVVGAIAWTTSSKWQGISQRNRELPPAWLGSVVVGLTGLVALQLVIAATMRHQHAGLAIPDFPLAYGQLYPPTDAASLASINQHRNLLVDDLPVTANQIHLQMMHRFVALTLLVGIVGLGVRLRGVAGWPQRFGWVWSGLILMQFGLGAATIWTNKAADLATAHVVFGAATLLTGVLFSTAVLRPTGLRIKETAYGLIGDPAKGLPPVPTMRSARSSAN
jgi:cytochrome c oxidase assembly protein subunit 15